MKRLQSGTEAQLRRYTVRLLQLLWLILPWPHIAPAQNCSTINFISTTTKICAPDTAIFQATNLPAGSSCYWHLGSGPFLPGGIIASKIFATPGAYTISLIVRLPDGTLCDTIIKKDYIRVFLQPKPVINITSPVTMCNGPGSLFFSDNTAGSVARTWAVDGHTYSAKSFTHGFTTYGNKNVTLSVTDLNGCTSTITKLNLIKVIQPVDIDFCLNATITPQNISATINPEINTHGNTVTSYTWTFPGGNPASSSLPVPPLINYSDITKKRDVSLRITTAEGCSYNLVRPDFIQKFIAISDDSICIPEKILVTNLANSQGRSNFSMDFNGIKFDTAAVGTVKFGYTEPGNYDLIFKFSYGGGKCENTILFPKFLNVKGPKVAFTSPDRLGCDVPFMVRLQNQSIVSGGINTFIWNITDPDGLPAAGTPIYTNGVSDTMVVLQKKGEYHIELTGYGSNGCSDSVIRKKFIRIERPKADFFAKDTLICAGQNAYMIDMVSPPDDTTTPYIYEWLFTNEDDPSVSIPTNGKSPAVTLTIPGRYHVKLIVRSGPTCADTLTKKYYIRVKGIVAQIIMNGSTGCIPYSTLATAKILINTPATPQNTISYKWEVSPAAGVTLSNPFAASTSMNFTRSGCYTVILKLTNVDGCFLDISKTNVVCIGVSAYYETDSNFCRNTPIMLHDLSSLNPTYFKWVASPDAGVSFHPSDLSQNPVVKFDRDTTYEISLVAGRMVNNKMCLDTFSRIINVPGLTADFMNYDSVRYCAPLIVEFLNHSVGAVNYVWDFGDGTTLESPLRDPAHGYTMNNTSGYDIKMTAVSKLGCRDSIKRTVRIIGPTPGFTMDNDHFCGEGTVTFTNTSRNSTYFVLDYGDSRTDTNQVYPHTYKFVEEGRDSNMYQVIMLAKDAICPDGSLFSDTIVIYRPAEANFISDTTTGCPPLTVKFTDISNAAISRTWDLNNDGVTDDTAKTTFQKYGPGVHDVKLSYTSKYGCGDTTVKSGFIRVNEFVKGDVRILNNILCSGAIVFFEAFNTSPGATVRWDFGDPFTTADTALGMIANYSYFLPGTYSVTIRIEDPNGCISELIKTGIVAIPNTIAPPTPFMNFVTVENDMTVKTSWRKTPFSEFKKYELRVTQNGVETVLYSTGNINDTVFIHSANVKVDQLTYNYTLWVENNCGQRSPAIMHNNILLKVSDYPAGGNLLTWTAYQAWPDVIYKVYRTKAGGAVEYLGKTTDFTYADSNLCDFEYCYFVEAGDKNSTFTSMSNNSCNRPSYLYQSIPLNLTRTTVIDNKMTGTRWEKSIQSNVQEYIVDRFDAHHGWQYTYAITTDTVFFDADAKINRESYRYRVSVLDKCQNLSSPSNTGSSILLSSQLQQDQININWNSYQEWNKGVESYTVQLRDKDHVFRTIKELPGTDTAYTDQEVHKDLDTAYCYMVVAVEKGMKPDSSVSNISCSVLPSRVYIPSAFTPNDDGLNDVFHISYISIFNLTGTTMSSYEMKIFDRWGGLIFQTDDVNKGWDGTLNGIPVQSGAYVYLVTASGLDNTNYNLSGTVTLLR
jgi:gliding motility-associated-like protein